MTDSAQYLGVHVSYVGTGANSLLLLIACQRNVHDIASYFVDISLMFASIILCANGKSKLV